MKNETRKAVKKSRKAGLHLSRMDVFQSRLKAQCRESRGLQAIAWLARRLPVRPFREARRAVTRELEQSVIMQLLHRFFAFLLSVRLTSLGVLLLSVGLWSTAGQLVKSLLLQRDISLDILLFGGVLLVISFPLLLSGTTNVSRGILGSRILRYVLFDLLGLYESPFRQSNIHEGGHFTAFLIGLLVGLLTLIVNPLYLFGTVGALLLAGIVLQSPEAGVILLAGFLPFASKGILAAFVLFIWLSLLLKVARGKRRLQFGFSDSLLAAYGLFVLLGTLFPLSETSDWKEGFLRLLTLSVAFLVLNLQKSRRFAYRCVSMLSISVFGCLAIGIYGYLVQGAELFLSGGGFPFSRAVMHGVFESRTVFACYLAMVLPFLLLLHGHTRRVVSSKMRVFLLMALCTLCLLLTWDIPGLLVAFFSLLLFFFLMHKKGLFGGMLLGGGSLVILAMTGIFDRISLSEKLMAGMADRLQVILGYLRLVSKSPLIGAGSGASAVYGVYQTEASAAYLSADESGSFLLQILLENGILGLLLFLALLLGVLLRCSYAAKLGSRDEDRKGRHLLAAGVSMLLILPVVGLFLNPLAVFATELLFWLLLGITAASAEELVRKNSLEFLETENEMTLIYGIAPVKMGARSSLQDED